MSGSSSAISPRDALGRRLEVAPDRVTERGVLVAPLGERSRGRARSRARRACPAGAAAPRPCGPRVASGRWRLPPKKARKPTGCRGSAASTVVERLAERVPRHRHRAVRAQPRQPVPAADRDDPVGAVHRRDGQQGHAGGVRARTRRRPTSRPRTRSSSRTSSTPPGSSAPRPRTSSAWARRSTSGSTARCPPRSTTS